MSCFFCESSVHLSHHCDRYTSNESKRQFVISKDLCSVCLSPSHPAGSRCITKCYNCFSNEHHRVFCSENGMFVPKIDQDLFPKFFGILSSDEQYSMAFTYPSAIKLKDLKRLVVKEYIKDFDFVEEHRDCIFILSGTVDLATSRVQKKVFDLLSQKRIIVKNKIMYLYSANNFSVDLFLHLLTPFTKTLICGFVDFDAIIPFSVILAKLQNIEEMELQSTNIKLENSWPKDLMGNKNNFRALSLDIDDFNFNVADLAEFMKTKMCKVGTISLYLPNNTSSNLENQFEERLTQWFCLKDKSLSSPIVKIFYVSKSCEYVCKNVSEI